MTHALDAVLVHQVHDQLQLVQALEVGEARVIARLHEGLEAGTDQLCRPAAQHRLLAEQVGLAFVLERRLDHPGTRPANALRVGEDEVPGVAGRVLVDGHQAWDTWSAGATMPTSTSAGG